MHSTTHTCRGVRILCLVSPEKWIYLLIYATKNAITVHDHTRVPVLVPATLIYALWIVCNERGLYCR
jgi:hypothetical protein